MTINGTRVNGATQFEVVNPATGNPFAFAPACSAEQLDDAVMAADTAYQAWRLDEGERRTALIAMASAVEKAVNDLAAIMTAEQGKPLSDSRAEILRAASWFRYYAELDTSPIIVQDDDQGYAEVHRRPLGVVAAITPWNFPLLVPMWKIAPALLAGNTVVLKPSPYTPLSALALGELLAPLLPPGVLNVISGPEPLGAGLAGHPKVRKISFTGSTAVGKLVAAAAAPDLKRVTLELGGNDPAVVLDDVDPGALAEDLFWGAFRNNGQICACIKRIYAPEKIYDDIVTAIAAYARSVRVDDGMVPGAQLGPVNNAPQLARVKDLTEDALAHGAVAASGGKAVDRPGYFFEPTILSCISDGSRVVDEEQFGPTLPIVPYRDVDDAIRRANGSLYGLTASVWGTDLDRAAAVASRIDAGQVSINLHGRGVRPDLPFGGHKWSGIGVENGPWGFDALTQPQVFTGPPRSAR